MLTGGTGVLVGDGDVVATTSVALAAATVVAAPTAGCSDVGGMTAVPRPNLAESDSSLPAFETTSLTIKYVRETKPSDKNNQQDCEGRQALQKRPLIVR